MKKHIALLILLFGSLSYGQTVIYQNAPDRQKIGFDTITGDISLQNSPPINISSFVKNNAASLIIWNDSISQTIGPDEGNNIFVSDSTETVDKIFIIQNQANGEYTEDVGYTFITQGDGKIFVKGETGAGVDPVEVSTIGKAYSLLRKGANTWIPFGTSVPWSGCNADPNEINTIANPTSDPYCNEGTTITSVGFSNSAGPTDMVRELSTDAYSGDYSLKVNLLTAGTGNRNAWFQITGVLAGETYRVRVRAKSTQGALVRMGSFTNTVETSTQIILNSEWQEGDWTVTALASGQINMLFTIAISSSFSIGDNVFIDDLSVVKLPCIPVDGELNVGPNAASDSNCNESNATTGLSIAGGSISSETDSSVGAYAIKGAATGGAVGYIHYNITGVTIGDTYTVSFDAKSTQGSLSRLTAWTNCTGGPNAVVPTSTYTTYTYNITATASSNINLRFYMSSTTSGVAGDNIFVDNLSIIKTN